MSDYLAAEIPGSKVGPATAIPQSQPVDPAQKLNGAGGYVFQVEGMERLNRFLMLGTQGGTMYTSQKDLTRENIDNIVQLIQADGMAVAQRVYEVSIQGLAHRQQPTLFVWAILLRYADEATSAWVRDHTSEVCRTGTMITQLATYIDAIGGWGNAKKSAIASFYTSRDALSLAYQAAKYPSRNGWTHRDLLRKSHARVADEGWNAVVQTILGKLSPLELEERIGKNALSGAAHAHAASSPAEIAAIVKEYNLAWEMIPTQALNTSEIWDELVLNSGYAALVRNLNRLTKIGWAAPASKNTAWLADKLVDPTFVSKSRIHPFAIYLALKAYSGQTTVDHYLGNRGRSGALGYTPLPLLVDALDEAFNLAFKNVEPTGLRYSIGCDVSGSMWWNEIAPSVTPGEAAGVMALILLRTEKNVHFAGFGTEMVDIPLTGRTALRDVNHIMERAAGGGTDCGAMFNWAKRHKYEFDCFVTFTDNETWCGRNHPHIALQEYRRSVVPGARSLVAAMTATDSSIADPNDPGMLDVCGFDSSLPQILRSFALGEV